MCRTRIIVSQRDIISESANNDRHWRRRFLPPALRRTYAMADAVVAVSRGVAEDLTSTTGLSREAISVIYNPVVDDKFVQLAAAPLDHPWFRTGEPPVLLAVGRLAPQKDYPTLIEAFAGVRAKRAARLLSWATERTRRTRQGSARPSCRSLHGRTSPTISS